jgi:putative phage-type endonuclease
MNIIELGQGGEDWEAWRHNGVGASDLAAILGISPFDDATRASMLEEKVQRLRRPINFAMRRGTRMEPIARDAYLAMTPTIQARPVCVQHPGHSWARASLDLLCCDTGSMWVVEIKCPNKDRQIEAAAGFVPYYYQAQCQWQLFCSGLNRLDYFSYSDLDSIPEHKRRAIVPVERDEALIRRLVEVAAEFWMEVIDERERREVAA